MRIPRPIAPPATIKLDAGRVHSAAEPVEVRFESFRSLTAHSMDTVPAWRSLHPDDRAAVIETLDRGTDALLSIDPAVEILIASELLCHGFSPEQGVSYRIIATAICSIVGTHPLLKEAKQRAIMPLSGLRVDLRNAIRDGKPNAARLLDIARLLRGDITPLWRSNDTDTRVPAGPDKPSLGFDLLTFGGFTAQRAAERRLAKIADMKFIVTRGAYAPRIFSLKH